jgi:hypothetical protein
VIRWIYRSLPGPRRLRVTLFLLLTLAFLVFLHFFYTWIGDSVLDTGGSVG